MNTATVLPAFEASSELIDAICALKMQHWPHPLASQRRWMQEYAEPGDRFVMLRCESTLAAFLRIRVRRARTAGTEGLLMCCTEVCVHAQWTGQGVGKALMQLAVDTMATQPGWIAYLLSGSETGGFYRSCGWQELDVDVRTSDGEGAPQPLAAGVGSYWAGDVDRVETPVVLYGRCF